MVDRDKRGGAYFGKVITSLFIAFAASVTQPVAADTAVAHPAGTKIPYTVDGVAVQLRCGFLEDDAVTTPYGNVFSTVKVWGKDADQKVVFKIENPETHRLRYVEIVRDPKLFAAVDEACHAAGGAKRKTAVDRLARAVRTRAFAP